MELATTAGGALASPPFSERLEALGSSLKSQIMSDLNSWEDRRRSEAQATRNKKFSNKRQRPLPLPDISREILVDIRWVRHILYSQITPRILDTSTEVSQWAVCVLSVFVSVADMKGNCKLDDLISLPGAKAVFQLLVLAVESGFPYVGQENAEMSFVKTVLGTTRDPRATGWILKQYGILHRSSFIKCLHLYAISKIPSTIDSSTSAATTNAAALSLSPESSGLTQAISDLATAYPAENISALGGILYMYRDAIQQASAAEQIPMNDARRYILFYMLQSHQGQKSLLLGDADHDKASVDLVTSQEWLPSAIRFEMRSGFSQFVKHSNETQIIRPLGESIDVMFGDVGKAKKASDQHLDISRTLGVLSFINFIVRGARTTPVSVDSEVDADMDEQETEMDTECVLFIDACHQTLVQLIAREQELVILHQMAKTVKNMPQPIPNGLQEAVQRGARAYNRGALAMPTVAQPEADSLLRRLFAVVAEVAGEKSSTGGSGYYASSSAKKLHEMVCDTLPMLVEILATQIETPSVVKGLVKELVDRWPLRTSLKGGQVDMDWVLSLYRSLLAISEGSRGLVLKQLLHIFESNLKNPEISGSLKHLRQMVDLMAAAAEHQYVMMKNPAADASKYLRGVREVIGDLCGCLTVSWKSLWTLCFQQQQQQQQEQRQQELGIESKDKSCNSDMCSNDVALEMRISIVRAMTRLVSLATGLRSIDRLALTRCVLKGLVKVQEKGSQDAHEAAEQKMELFRALMSLILVLAKDRGVERVAMEEIVQALLACPPLAATGHDSDCRSSSAMDELEAMLEGSVLSSTNNVNGRQIQEREGKEKLAMAESLIWQNAVRPLPRYPRDGIKNHDRAGDSWRFVRPKSVVRAQKRSSAGAVLDSEGTGDLDDEAQPGLLYGEIGAVSRPALVFTLLSLSQCTPSGMGALAQLLEEYYIDSIPGLPPALLDERLSGGRLQLRPVEMELLQDCRSNHDLEHVILEMIRDPSGRVAAKRLASSLLVALIVLWNGALGEATTKRPEDLAFTTRLVAHILDAYGDSGKRSKHLCKVFPLVGGSDLARILHQRVWRWIVHRMPSAEDESQRLLNHILRKHIAHTASLFKYLYSN
ncbi:hypothetical protein GGI12_001493 [Dipsacomyces acuminosporus]|nr:hypothetical protein GGI12_001493 [Dipsacomyces acuminosporus]